MILGVDCTLSGVSLGLAAQGRVYGRVLAQARGSDLLLPLLKDMLDEAGAAAGEITQVVVTVGPGSFTGIRLGLALAEGLRLLKPDLAVKGVGTLPALAAQVAAEGVSEAFSVLLDAAGGQAYRQDFNAEGVALGAVTCGPLAELRDLRPRVVAQAGLLPPFAVQQVVAGLRAEVLVGLAARPELHLAPVPLYVKALGYRRAD
jgi:tRNA threonylcarbamoyladenosine biosynthesis protein TsaB